MKWLVLASALSAASALAETRATVETTLSWKELEKLLARDGERAERPSPNAPRAFALSRATVNGSVDGARCSLELDLDVDVLADGWVVVPLLPPKLDIASSRINGEGRAMLVRDATGIALVAHGAGRYAVNLSIEGALEKVTNGHRLRIALPGLTGGTASLLLREGEPSGSGWKAQPLPDGTSRIEAVLGSNGLELDVQSAAPHREASDTLEGLEARTVLSLSGSGVARMKLQATPGESGALELTLPKGAQLWKAYVDGVPLEPNAIARANQLHLPLKHASHVELAYTFSVPPLGIRGRYHVELPRFSAPVRGASWQLFLPDGLAYSELQSSLAPQPACEVDDAAARIALPGQGPCVALQRAVLEGAAYAEGSYAQAL